MTNKTILNLKKLKSFHIHNGNYDPDIDRAIKALEQQFNMISRSAYEQVMWERDVVIKQLKELGYGLGEKIKTDKDAISRQAAIEAFQMFRGYEANRTNAEWVDRIETVVKKLPSVKPQEPMREFTEEEAKAYSKALGKIYKPTGFNVFNEPCGDCINRQVIKEQMIKYGFHAPDMTVTEFVEDLPSVNPQPKTEQFAEWVATEIFDNNWEYNKNAFAELACRKLAKLGIVRAKGDEWELVDHQESEGINEDN